MNTTAVLVDAKPLKIPRPKLFYGSAGAMMSLNSTRSVDYPPKSTSTTPLPDYDDPPASGYLNHQLHRFPAPHHNYNHHYQPHHRLNSMIITDNPAPGETETEVGRSAASATSVRK